MEKETNKNSIKKGHWKHYKGGNYIVIDTIIDTTREEYVVLYRNYEGMMFIRTIADFLSIVEKDGIEEKRFTFLGYEPL